MSTRLTEQLKMLNLST